MDCPRTMARWRNSAVLLLCTFAVAVVAWPVGMAFVGTAEASTTSATLAGGDVKISTPLSVGTFSGVLSGESALCTGTGFSSAPSFVITDARGTGVGWSVTLQATQFENLTSPGHDLRLGSLTAPEFAAESEGGGVAPGFLHAATQIDGTPVQIVDCLGSGQGMGTWSFAAPADAWTLAVAAGDYAGSYTSTITITLATH